MTKAEEFDKARRRAYEGDFSLVEKLYDPDCKHFDHRAGMEVSLDKQNAIMSAYENSIFGPFRVIYENEEFLCIHRYVKWTQELKTYSYKNASEGEGPSIQQELVTKQPIYWTMISCLEFKNLKIVRHETAFEVLDYDPSEGKDWNWEDYK